MTRQKISCFKGLAPVSIPQEWLEGFDPKTSFAYVNREALIRFPNGKAFGVQVEPDGSEVRRYVRGLPEQADIPWGPFCSAWESYHTAEAFGHGEVTPLDQISL